MLRGWVPGPGNVVRIAAWAVVAICLSSSPPRAESFPSHPIHVVVGFPAGGGADTVVRIISEALQQELGVPIVVDNRPGADGLVGTRSAAAATPDGYTLLAANRGILVFNVGFYNDLGYDPASSFKPVGLITRGYSVLVVGKDSSIHSLKDLIDQAKAKPGSLNYASPATASMLAMELFKRQAGVEITRVPYKGAAPAVTDVIAGQVQTMMLDTITALPQIKAGQLHALAAVTSVRLPSLPDVQTMDEAGIKGVESLSWFGLLAPKGVPDDIIDRLSAGLQRVMRMPAVDDRLRGLGYEPSPTTSTEMTKILLDDLQIWPKQIRDWGLTMN
jgi:tripartite-type tricarboxylate transporter receptor subunit TctC